MENHLSHNSRNLPNRSSTKKPQSNNGNGVKTTTTYDDVFGGPPRFGGPTLSPCLEDYCEIFSVFSSIPVLDLPLHDKGSYFDDVWRESFFDYPEVFGGFNGLDLAPSYEELFMQRMADDDGDGDSSDDAWSREEESVSGKRSLSFSNGRDSIDDASCTEVNQTSISSRGGVIRVASAPDDDDQVVGASGRPKTHPTGIPPPSRPPPVLKTRFTSSGSPPFFDVEVDARSSAAVRETAMVVKLKSAKREEGKSSRAAGLHGLESNMDVARRSMMRDKNGSKSLSSQGSVNSDGNEEWEEATQFVELVRTEQPRNADENCGGREDVVPFPLGFFDQKLPKHPRTRNVASSKHKRHENMLAEKTPQEPKNEELRDVELQFGILCNNLTYHGGIVNQRNLIRQEESKPLTEKLSKQKKGDRKAAEKNQDNVFDWEQNARKLREALGLSDNESTLEVPLGMGGETGEREIKLKDALRRMEEAESEKRLINAALEQEEKIKKLKEEDERREAESREKAEEEEEEEERKRKEQEENELRRLKEAFEKEEENRKMREAREKAEQERIRKEQEEYELKLKEAFEKEEKNRRMRENERKMKEAREKEENERRIKEAHEKAELERRMKITLEREDKERKLKELQEREANERRAKEALEQAENEKKLKEAREKEENEKKLKEAIELDEKEKRLIEAFERAETERRLKEEVEQEEMRLQEANERERTLREHHERQEKEMKQHKDTREERQGDTCEMEKTYETTDGDGEQENLSDTLEEDERVDNHEPVNKVLVEEEGPSQRISLSEEACPWKVFEKNLKDASQKEGTNELDTESVKLNEESGKESASVTDNVQGGKLNQKSKTEEERSEDEKVRNGSVGGDQRNPEENKSANKASSRPLPSRVFMEREKEAERLKRELDSKMEHLRKIEEEREREREKEKDRMAFDQRALADARERLEKACAEARDKSFPDIKASTEARLRAERAAVERATAEARERAAEKAAFEARDRMERSVSDKQLKSSGSFGERMERSGSEKQFQNSASFGASRYRNSPGADGESPQRYTSRLERHRRTADRVAKALAEKNMRDLVAQREQAERTRIAETLDAEVKRWSSGKEGNIRALLSTLQYIMGSESGWQPIPLTEVITSAAVKRAYRKATLCVHPDKLQQRGANIHQKYICEKVFDLLKEAWNRFNSEER